MNARLARGLMAAAAVALIPASNTLRAEEAQPMATVQPVRLAAAPEVERKPPALADMLPSIQRKRQEKADPSEANLFKQKSWYVPPPPPPPPKPLPPPPPTAPPLPFSYVGSYQDGGGPLIIFLAKGDQLYKVSPGDVIEGTYRVEGIASGQLGLVYLPLNIRQTLAAGGAS